MRLKPDSSQKLMESALIISLAVLVAIIVLSLNTQNIVALFDYIRGVVDGIVNI